MIDWNADTELKAMRDEFIASFAERRRALAVALRTRDVKEVQFVAHKLAGAAATYGFPTLSRIGGALDDALDSGFLGQGDLPEFTALLDEALSEAAKSGDPSLFAQDPRLRKLEKILGEVGED